MKRKHASNRPIKFSAILLCLAFVLSIMALPVSAADRTGSAGAAFRYEHDPRLNAKAMADIIVDRACLDAIEAAGKASPDKVIRDYAKSQVAVTNIKIAVRSAKTKKSLDFLHKALAPCASFDVRTLAQAAFQGVDALLDYLSSSGYAEAAEALKKSPSAFERWCDNRVIETIKPQKYEVCTVGPLVAYVLARQNEIKTARIVITGKANGLSDEAIRERTREMYV